MLMELFYCSRINFQFVLPGDAFEGNEDSNFSFANNPINMEIPGNTWDYKHLSKPVRVLLLPGEVWNCYGSLYSRQSH